MTTSSSSHSPELSAFELATVLAALRFWQRAVPAKDARAYSPEHFRSVAPMSHSEIDSLCEKLNCGAASTSFEDAIGQIRSILWQTPQGWDAEKKWQIETIEYVAGVLKDMGLRP